MPVIVSHVARGFPAAEVGAERAHRLADKSGAPGDEPKPEDEGTIRLPSKTVVELADYARLQRLADGGEGAH